MCIASVEGTVTDIGGHRSPRRVKGGRAANGGSVPAISVSHGQRFVKMAPETGQ